MSVPKGKHDLELRGRCFAFRPWAAVVTKEIYLLYCDTGLDLAVLSAAAVYLRPAWLKRGFCHALL